MWLDHIANDLSTLLLLLLSYYGFFLQYLQNPIHIVCFMVLLLPSPLDPLSVLPLSDIKATCESVLGGKIVLWWLGIEHQAQSTKLMSNWEFEHITLKSVKPWYQSTHLSKLYSRLTFEFFYHCVLLMDEGNIYCMLEQHPPPVTPRAQYCQTRWYRS